MEPVAETLTMKASAECELRLGVPGSDQALNGACRQRGGPQPDKARCSHGRITKGNQGLAAGSSYSWWRRDQHPRWERLRRHLPSPLQPPPQEQERWLALLQAQSPCPVSWPGTS